MKRIASFLAVPVILAGCAQAPPMKVLTPAGGYALSGPKRATVVGHSGDLVTEWRVICTSCGKVFAHGLAQPQPAGGNLHTWTIDFSAMDIEDEVIIECDTNHGTLDSEPFKVGETSKTPTTRRTR